MKPPKYELSLEVDAASSLSLQHQVRQRLIDAMSHGVLRPGRRLPSSRRLAQQIGVSRNTVSLAYDALLAEGHLISRPRSGVFVASSVQSERVTTGRQGLRSAVRDSGKPPVQTESQDFRVPPNWLQYPFPFLDGCIEHELIPIDGWRESLRLAFAKQDVLRWATNVSDADDPKLIDEMRTHVLPSWGVDAAPDEVIATVSVQQAFYLVLETLVDRQTVVLCDVALDQELQNCFKDAGNRVPLLWDGGSARLLSTIPRDAVIVVGTRRTQSSSIATRERAVALLQAAEESKATIVECVPTFDLRESSRSNFLLRTLDRTRCVISVGGLASAASLGTAPGIIYCDSLRMARIRRLRHQSGSVFPFGLQRAWSYFIGLGYYASARSRAGTRLMERRTALRDALNHYLHRFVTIRTFANSSAYWISVNTSLQPDQLAHRAAAVGVLIEPVFANDGQPQFCMGVTSLRKERIREGVEKLARLIRSDPQLGSRRLQDETAPVLKGAALRRALSGATLLYNTAYGDPCTLVVGADGVLSGSAGYSNEDQDTGHWWIENDMWFRQWQHWAYGESLGLITVVEHDQVRWFNTDGLLVDTAVIVKRKRGRT